jgi:type II secretory pathway pseudopilin PulG
MSCRVQRRLAFTLAEMLVVLAVVVTLFGMVIGSFPRTDLRYQSVKAAAEELAATCRQARARAIGQSTTTAIVFHIENAPDSTGRVLNNRSGGHWYRILGSMAQTQESNLYKKVPDMSCRADNLPPMTGDVVGGVITSAPYNMYQFAQENVQSWQGAVHVLPAGRVRFLALTDMDYGDFGYTAATKRRAPSGAVSYPRPWFGWYDASTRRLYPWGGYDPMLPGSGFYYRGNAAAGTYGIVDAEPSGCINADRRVLDHWLDSQQTQGSGGASAQAPAIPAGDPTNIDILYAQGSPRPLINAAWRDMGLVFLASGEVQWAGCMPARHCLNFRNDMPALTPAVSRGVAERCNGQFAAAGALDQHAQTEAGNFDRVSGGWYITLSPDVPRDIDVFPDSRSALESLTPMFRVFVSVLGDVRVVCVSRTKKFGTLSPWPTAPTDWSTQMVTKFPRDQYLDGTGAPAGLPITDFITEDMLANRSVWMQ